MSHRCFVCGAPSSVQDSGAPTGFCSAACRATSLAHAEERRAREIEWAVAEARRRGQPILYSSTWIGCGGTGLLLNVACPDGRLITGKTMMEGRPGPYSDEGPHDEMRAAFERGLVSPE